MKAITAHYVLVDLLKQAKQVSENNIEKADNFDLEDFSYRISNMIDELIDVGEFEQYDDDQAMFDYNRMEEEWEIANYNEMNNEQQ